MMKITTGQSIVATLLATSLLLLQSGTTFAAVAPTITNISPSSGPSAGGTDITITGTGFASSTTVQIGGSAASSTVISDSSILASTPPGTGAADLVLSNGDGTFATSTGGFTYTSLALPTLSSIAITTPADKLTYHVGEPLDLTGLVVTGTYSDSSTSTVPIDVGNVTGFDSSVASFGQFLTIATGSVSTNFLVNILQTPLSLATSTNGDGSISGTISSETAASAMNGSVTILLDIPSGTVVTGGSSWDGTVTLPFATSGFTLTPSSGNTASAVAAIEVGAGDTPLSLSNPAKITFVGQAGKLAGWSQGGVFNPITSVCDSTSTAPTLATSTASGNKDCKVDIGSDLVVWTTHLTEFIAYTESATATATPSPSPAPIQSGGGPIGLIGFQAQSQPAPVPTPTPSPTPTTGQVLGASTYNFVTTLTIGSTGEAVTALQNILTEQGFFSGPVTGYFGKITQAAVKAFQSAHSISPIGIVGPQTRAALNSLTSNGGMTDSARQTLIALLMQKLQQLYTQIAALTASSTSATSTSAMSTTTTAASTTTSTSMTSTSTTATSTSTATSTTM